MFTRRQHADARDDDRERITKAHQEAEALFTLKPSISEPESLAPAAPSTRKPRVLRALPSVPRHENDRAPGQGEAPEIPSSQFARIRAYVKYGMTATQIAGVYGVAVNAIERVLQQT